MGARGGVWYVVIAMHFSFGLFMCVFKGESIANAGMRRGTGADLKTGADANEAHQIHLSPVQFRIRSFDKGGR